MIFLLFCFTVSVVMKPAPSDTAENLPVSHVPVSVAKFCTRMIYCDLLYIRVLQAVVIKLNLCDSEVSL